MDLFMKNLRLQFQCKRKICFRSKENLICFFYSDGEEDEDDEGISERSLRRTPSDDGKDKMIAFFTMRRIICLTFL